VNAAIDAWRIGEVETLSEVGLFGWMWETEKVCQSLNTRFTLWYIQLHVQVIEYGDHARIWAYQEETVTMRRIWFGFEQLKFVCTIASSIEVQ